MATVALSVRKAGLTTWEGIWYVLQCIAFGAGYFAKIPVKKALQDYGLVEMTGAERFWYVLQCIAFGAGYFAKIPVAKALSELPQYRAARQNSLSSLSSASTGRLAGSKEPPALNQAPPAPSSSSVSDKPQWDREQ
jgi:hypothetical protein